LKVLEKELSDSLKENKNYSNKLVEMLTENMKIKENNENLISSNSAKTSRIQELENIIKNQDIGIQSLSDNEVYLKTNISKVEKENFKLNEYFLNLIINFVGV
jgi:hypothetical protein